MQKVVQAVVVAVIKRLFVCFFCFCTFSLQAAVLPEDRVDILYFNYEGDEIEIQGPTLLVRKSIGNQVSVNAHYLVDKVSGASIDVRASGASAYQEERTETAFGVDYLKGKTLISIGHTQSKENDFDAKSTSISIAQDFFGDLSTVSFGYSRGGDVIRSSIDQSFRKQAERQHYRLSWTQVLTPTLIASLNYEGITDEGYLQNPYRSVRFKIADNFSRERENYPRTRTSSAIALRARYHLPYRAAVYFEARHYSDTWKIEANHLKFGYVHPIENKWVLDFSWRHYQQSAAEFYADVFNGPNLSLNGAENVFRARDKELSEFATDTLGFNVSYYIEHKQNWLNDMIVTLFLDYIRFDYANFRDAAQTSAGPGNEPLLKFGALLTRLQLSWRF